MNLVQIVKRTIAAGVLIAAAGCTYFNHVPDHKIEESKPNVKEDADWAKKYRGLHEIECYFLVEDEPFGKMTPEQVKELVKTELEAQIYVVWLGYKGEGLEIVPFSTTSFPVTHENARKGKVANDCSDDAAAAAAILVDNGYKPYLLRLEGAEDHEAFIFKINNKFHTICGWYAQRKFPDGHDSTNELVKKQYPDIKKYSVYFLPNYFPDWQTSKGNILVKARATEKVK